MLIKSEESNKKVKLKVKRRNKLKEESLIEDRKNLVEKIIVNIIIIIEFFFRYAYVYILPNIQSIKLYDSKISLRIKGIGLAKIFNTHKPYLMYINGINTTIQNQIYLNETDNYAELIYRFALTNTSYMFYECSNITEINFSLFDSSKVTKMFSMFRDCASLTSINFNNFSVSKVKQMNYMFSGCNSLIELDLSNFTAYEIEDMDYMFANCSSLVSVKFLKYISASSLSWIQYMFYGCSSLTSLDLKNLHTNNVRYMEYMFYNCTNLEYINFPNLDTTRLSNGNDYNFLGGDFDGRLGIFDNVPDNIVICYDSSKASQLNSKINNINCKINDCDSNWKLKQLKINEINSTCMDNCTGEVEFEHNGKCLKKCQNDYYEEDNRKICKCELEKCSLCPSVALKLGLCSKCNYDYYPKENDPLNIGDYFNCYKDPEGYYLDKTDYLYKKISDKLEQPVNKTSFVSNIYAPIATDIINISTFINLPISEILNSKDTHEFCDKDKPFENKLIHECVRICSIENIVNEICILNYKISEKENYFEEYAKVQDILLKNIEIGLISQEFNTTILDMGEDYLIKTERMKITLTTSENQRKYHDYNITTIDLAQCESELRDFYNMTYNQKLYINKIDVIQDGMNIPKIEYDIYAKLNGTNLMKLDKSICKSSKIILNIPIEIKEVNLDKLNTSSGYFNDFCYTETTKEGTDISLKDRKNEFIVGNKTVCQDDCDFSNYDKDIKKVECICEVKETVLSFANITININKLYKNFLDIKNIANINILKCYKILFCKSGLIYNIGSYIILIIFLFNVICIIIFYSSQFNKLKMKINILFSKKKVGFIFDKLKKGNKNKKDDQEISCKSDLNDRDKKIKNIINSNDNFDKKSVSNFNLAKIKVKKGKKSKFRKKEKKFINNKDTELEKNSNSEKNKIKLKIKTQNEKNKNNKEKINKLKNKMKLIETQINLLPYKLAIKKDKRSYCQYYVSLIKTKHPIFFSFLYIDDYNPRIIKINLFFLSFTIYYLVAALFYNDDTMHQLYKNKGSFDLEYSLPQIIYSSLISIALNTLLKILALSNDTILEFKEKNNKKYDNLIFKISIKFLLFFIISFIFLVLFWYYLAMFCAVYKNTQYNLIKDTLIGFGLSLIYPFGIYLLPGMFRIPSLANKEKKREILYKISKIFQML